MRPSLLFMSKMIENAQNCTFLECPLWVKAGVRDHIGRAAGFERIAITCS